MPTSSSAFLHRCAAVFLATAAVGVAVPAPAGAVGDPRSSEQWAMSPDAVLHLPPAWEIFAWRGRRRRRDRLRRKARPHGPRAEHLDQLRRGAGQPRRRRPQRLRRRRPRRRLLDLARRQRPERRLGPRHPVAGIIAAAQNGRGVVGVAPRARLMILKVLDKNGAGTTNGVSEAIRYAAANGARVINLSLSGPKDDPGLRSAVAAAAAANVLLVTSAGNDGLDVDRKPTTPRRSRHRTSSRSPARRRRSGASSATTRTSAAARSRSRRRVPTSSSTADGGWG